MRKKGPPPTAEAIAKYPFKPVPLSNMTHGQLVKLAHKLGRAWERRTQRNQDMENLRERTTAQLRDFIRGHWSPEMAQIWADWEGVHQ